MTRSRSAIMDYAAAEEIVRPLLASMMEEYDFEGEVKLSEYTDDVGLSVFSVELLVDEDIAITPEQIRLLKDRVWEVLSWDERTWEYIPRVYFNVRNLAEAAE